jgi:hypothetical protein
VTNNQYDTYCRHDSGSSCERFTVYLALGSTYDVGNLDDSLASFFIFGCVCGMPWSRTNDHLNHAIGKFVFLVSFNACIFTYSSQLRKKTIHSRDSFSVINMGRSTQSG